MTLMRLNFLRLPKPCRVLVGLLCGLTGVTVSAADIASLEKQREMYQQAQQSLDNKDLEEFAKLRPQLDSYALTPYLDYRVFLLQLKDKTPAEVERFIAQSEDYPFSGRIRAPYLDALYQAQDWKNVLTFQRQEPNGESYQCIYYYAHYQQGARDKAFAAAKRLWLSGQGVADECDHLFAVWEQAGLRSDELILQRMLLAFEEKNGNLMTYLMKLPQSAKAQKQAQQMKALFTQPESVAEFAKKSKANDFNRMQAVHAFKKLARKDVVAAQAVFSDVVKAQKIPKPQAQELAEYVAFRLINTDDEKLAAWRDKTLAQSSRQTLIERRVRLAIQEADWAGVRQWILRLDDEHRQSLRWQYWLGRSDIALGKVTQGKQRLESLLGQRNFYSVAAAKEVGQSIEYPVTTLKLESERIAPFRTSLQRIEELIALDKIAAAKSEWRYLLSRTDDDTQAMLAVYAASKRWYHLTVTASISAKMWDNVEVRFPVAHRWWFNFYANKHNIDPITLMSLARQESAMDVEATSPVGARGIMQIMPSTARYTAKKYQLSYTGEDELYQVGKNIEIGSHYLNGLLEQYDNNRIFAFAAYNAGPNRVNSWRERTGGKLDAYAFIEAIPFKETRGYVQNILMFENYYRDILGVDGAFLNQHELETKY
ncbi:murein transglycosylase [Vibrio navarrensis]|uniref:murein transglycosylase n=1 Tax=Vibrio navarrensis TaxID=29495 RepID=UPI001302B0A2|nr:murein transglycosylase [Vibrio navarrensis]